MDRWCAIVESDATRALVDARNEVASIQLRARIHLIREIRNLPDVTRARISRLRDALEEEYGDA